MWIFKKGETLRETNAGIDAVPQLRQLSDKQLLYIYYVYCWNSPYFKAKLKEKKLLAARYSKMPWETSVDRPAKSTRDMMNLKNQKMNLAIVTFNNVQRLTDPDRYLLDALQSQINEIMEKISNPSKDVGELTKMVGISKALPLLVKQRNEIAEIVGLRDEAVLVEEEAILKELSTLDEYNEMTQDGS